MLSSTVVGVTPDTEQEAVEKLRPNTRREAADSEDPGKLMEAAGVVMRARQRRGAWT